MPEYLSRDRKAVPDEALIVDQVPEPRPADHEYASHADPLRDVGLHRSARAEGPNAVVATAVGRVTGARLLV